MNQVSADVVVRRTVERMFGRRLVNNVHRSILVEGMVACALGDQWTWCPEWSECDFKSTDGKVRIEIKQSAARQAWATKALPKPTFDIAPRNFVWTEETGSVARSGRNAEIYVFAYHSDVSDEADHRNPSEWSFYAIRSSELPASRSISIAVLERLVAPVGIERLANKVSILAERLHQVPR